MSDVIDLLAGLTADSALSAIRDRKPVTRDQAQASYLALFEPGAPGAMAMTERFAVASFVAELHADEAAFVFYSAKLPDGLRNAVRDAAVAARTTGPYGAYPAGPLSREDRAGPVYHGGEAFDARLRAALDHTHLLVFHPRDAGVADLRALLDAGWSEDGIVTLSQLVAFLTFQIRAAAGLRMLAGTVA